jgi:flavorubredoxin
MTRIERLNEILRNTQRALPDAEASALISEDGLMIASVMPSDVDEIVAGGMAATLLNLGTRAAVELKRGDLSILGGRRLKTIFLSHQDPDVVAACNGWLMTTAAEAHISNLWVRFVPHFGLDHLVEDRLKPIPDKGMSLALDGCELQVIPAHFLHSPGNFQVYDPISKILYSGDLGASLGAGYTFVTDFDAHLQYIEPFHRRFMASNAALRAWAAAVRRLDIEIIAPQHGALYRGREIVGRFITWCEGLECGVDLPGRSIPT